MINQCRLVKTNDAVILSLPKDSPAFVLNSSRLRQAQPDNLIQLLRMSSKIINNE